MDFFTLGKIFVLDNFNFVQDNKCFVWVDGRGICLRNFILNFLINKLNCDMF